MSSEARYGGGNVTYLVNTNQANVAIYKYDPFGNTISSSGSLASANVYRFSSKEVHVNSGMYYYGYRFYDPNLQRWLSRDSLGDQGSPQYTFGTTIYSLIREPVEVWQSANLFSFVMNQPTDMIDPLGLDARTGKKPGRLCTSKDCKKDLCAAKNLPEEGWGDKMRIGKDPWADIPNPGGCADSDGFASPDYGVIKIPDNCTVTIECNEYGYIKGDRGMRAECRGVYPKVRPAEPKDNFPPNPYDPKPPPKK